MWITNPLHRKSSAKAPEPDSKTDPFQRESEDNARKICTSRFFEIDVLGRQTGDVRVAHRRGCAIMFCSMFVILAVCYMWYHCYYASCEDCSSVLTPMLADEQTRLECHCSNCVVNHFFRPETHFEKCYYSQVLFSGFVVLFIFYLIKSLAFHIFRHSNIAQRD